MEKYLKPKQYYSDLYDRHTVERGRRMIRLDDSYVETVAKRDGLTKELAISFLSAWNEVAEYFFAGDRYVNKNKTIEELVSVRLAARQLRKVWKPLVSKI